MTEYLVNLSNTADCDVILLHIKYNKRKVQHYVSVHGIGQSTFNKTKFLYELFETCYYNRNETEQEFIISFY